MTTTYTTGTVTLTNGSSNVVGVGTAWVLSLIAGGVIFVQGAGNPMPIAAVVSDTQITASLVWTGATGTYAYALMRDTAYGQQTVENANALAQLLNQIQQGTVFKYDASGTLSGRSTYDGKAKGFAYLVIDTTPAKLYIKLSDASGNWAGPFSYGTGATGPAPNLSIGTVTTLASGAVATASIGGSNPNYTASFGIPAGAKGVNPRGTYSAGTAYAAFDAVLYGGSQWYALQATTGNPPPSLPATSNAYWSLLAQAGAAAGGAGDMLKATYDPQNKQADAFARANHTGTQAIATVSGLQGALDAKIGLNGSPGAMIGSIQDIILAPSADPSKNGIFDFSSVPTASASSMRFPAKPGGTLGAWEFIGSYAAAGAAIHVITGLGAFDKLRISFRGHPSANSGLFMRFSQDNGANFLQGADYYASENNATGGAFTNTYDAGSTALRFTGILNVASNVDVGGIWFMLEINKWNKANRTKGFWIGGLEAGSGAVHALNGSFEYIQPTINSALAFYFGSGTITSEVIIEGIRG